MGESQSGIIKAYSLARKRNSRIKKQESNGTVESKNDEWFKSTALTNKSFQIISGKNF